MSGDVDRCDGTVGGDGDNLVAAVDHVLEGLVPSVRKSTGAVAGAPAVKQLIVRVAPGVHEEWTAAAKRRDLSLNEFIRQCVQVEVDRIIHCQHPWESRKRYPWSEFCLECGQRLKG